MLGELLVQRRLQRRLGQLFQQPVRAVSDKPCSLAWRTSSRAAVSSAESGGDSFFLATASSVAVAVITPLLSARHHSERVRPETPLNPQSPHRRCGTGVSGCRQSCRRRSQRGHRSTVLELGLLHEVAIRPRAGRHGRGPPFFGQLEVDDSVRGDPTVCVKGNRSPISCSQ